MTTTTDALLQCPDPKCSYTHKNLVNVSFHFVSDHDGLLRRNDIKNAIDNNDYKLLSVMSKEELAVFCGHTTVSIRGMYQAYKVAIEALGLTGVDIIDDGTVDKTIKHEQIDDQDNGVPVHPSEVLVLPAPPPVVPEVILINSDTDSDCEEPEPVRRATEETEATTASQESRQVAAGNSSISPSPTLSPADYEPPPSTDIVGTSGAVVGNNRMTSSSLATESLSAEAIQFAMPNPVITTKVQSNVISFVPGELFSAERRPLSDDAMSTLSSMSTGFEVDDEQTVQSEQSSTPSLPPLPVTAKSTPPSLQERVSNILHRATPRVTLDHSVTRVTAAKATSITLPAVTTTGQKTQIRQDALGNSATRPPKHSDRKALGTNGSSKTTTYKLPAGATIKSAKKRALEPNNSVYDPLDDLLPPEIDTNVQQRVPTKSTLSKKKGKNGQTPRREPTITPTTIVAESNSVVAEEQPVKPEPLSDGAIAELTLCEHSLHVLARSEDHRLISKNGHLQLDITIESLREEIASRQIRSGQAFLIKVTQMFADIFRAELTSEEKRGAHRLAKLYAARGAPTIRNAINAAEELNRNRAPLDPSDVSTYCEVVDTGSAKRPSKAPENCDMMASTSVDLADQILSDSAILPGNEQHLEPETLPSSSRDPVMSVLSRASSCPSSYKIPKRTPCTPTSSLPTRTPEAETPGPPPCKLPRQIDPEGVHDPLDQLLPPDQDHTPPTVDQGDAGMSNDGVMSRNIFDQFGCGQDALADTAMRLHQASQNRSNGPRNPVLPSGEQSNAALGQSTPTTTTLNPTIVDQFENIVPFVAKQEPPDKVPTPLKVTPPVPVSSTVTIATDARPPLIIPDLTPQMLATLVSVKKEMINNQLQQSTTPSQPSSSSSSSVAVKREQINNYNTTSSDVLYRPSTSAVSGGTATSSSLDLNPQLQPPSKLSDIRGKLFEHLTCRQTIETTRNLISNIGDGDVKWVAEEMFSEPIQFLNFVASSKVLYSMMSKGVFRRYSKLLFAGAEKNIKRLVTIDDGYAFVEKLIAIDKNRVIELYKSNVDLFINSEYRFNLISVFCGKKMPVCGDMRYFVEESVRRETLFQSNEGFHCVLSLIKVWIQIKLGHDRCKGGKEKLGPFTKDVFKSLLNANWDACQKREILLVFYDYAPDLRICLHCKSKLRARFATFFGEYSNIAPLYDSSLKIIDMMHRFMTPDNFKQLFQSMDHDVFDVLADEIVPSSKMTGTLEQFDLKRMPQKPQNNIVWTALERCCEDDVTSETRLEFHNVFHIFSRLGCQRIMTNKIFCSVLNKAIKGIPKSTSIDRDRNAKALVKVFGEQFVDFLQGTDTLKLMSKLINFLRIRKSTVLVGELEEHFCEGLKRCQDLSNYKHFIQECPMDAIIPCLRKMLEWLEDQSKFMMTQQPQKVVEIIGLINCFLAYYIEEDNTETDDREELMRFLKYLADYIADLPNTHGMLTDLFSFRSGLMMIKDVLECAEHDDLTRLKRKLESLFHSERNINYAAGMFDEFEYVKSVCVKRPDGRQHRYSQQYSSHGYANYR